MRELFCWIRTAKQVLGGGDKWGVRCWGALGHGTFGRGTTREGERAEE